MAFMKSRSSARTETISKTDVASEQVTSGAEAAATSVAARDSEVVIDNSISSVSVDPEITELSLGAAVDMTQIAADLLEDTNKLYAQNQALLAEVTQELAESMAASQNAAVREVLDSSSDTNRQAFNLVSDSTARALNISEEFGEKSFQLAGETSDLVSESLRTLEDMTESNQDFAADLIDTLDSGFQRSLDAQKDFATTFPETFSRSQSSETTQLASEAIDVQKQLIIGVIILGTGFIIFRGLKF